MNDAWSSSHHVPRHRDHPQGPRPARRLGLHPALLRRLHHRPRDRLDPRGRECPQITIPANARLHPQPDHRRSSTCRTTSIHFYHLHALDWVDIVQRPQGRSGEDLALAQSISDWPKSSTRLLQRGAGSHQSPSSIRGQLGPFANGYWGHSAYKLPPEANLMAVAHYLEALEWQKEIIKIHAILGSKNPHPADLPRRRHGDPRRSRQPECPQRRHDRPHAASSSNRRARLCRAGLHPRPPGRRLLLQGLGGPSAAASATTSPTATSPMTTTGAPAASTSRAGIILARDLAKLLPVDREEDQRVCRPTPGTTTPAGDKKGLHPYDGRDQPQVHRAEAALRIPRHRQQILLGQVAALRRAADGGRAAGADARRVCSAATRCQRSGRLRPRASSASARRPSSRPSAAPRARGIDDLVLGAEESESGSSSSPTTWARGDLRTYNKEKWDPSTWPKEAQGYGFHEAPRGALGHWIRIEERHHRQLPGGRPLAPGTPAPRDARGSAARTNPP